MVDLWADWCGPCKTLGPILEKVIGETQGLVELAKVDVQANQQTAGAFQVQSIPAVYAMWEGKVIDGFVGALPEDEVVAFVQRVLDASSGSAPADTEGGDEDGAATESAPVDAVISEPGADVVPETPALSAEEADAAELELQELLVTVKGDDVARERFLEILEQLGPEDPRTNTYRRKLATALY